MEKTAFTLLNPQNGDLAFKIFSFENNSPFDHLQRHNYYSLILLTKGKGQLKANFSEHSISKKALGCFSPYQPYLIQSESEFSGVVVNFHPDFFCIFRHHNEEASKGVLFNNIYQPPFFQLTDEETEHFLGLISQMKAEMQKTELAQQELLILYLKIFIITAIRIKTKQHLQAKQEVENRKKPNVLQNLQEAIETHFKHKHGAGEYAEMLNISTKALAKLVKMHFNKTLTGLISERIVVEAKRELYLTSKPIKAIAYTLGFDDEYYFSRFFKKNAAVSPQLYRETVGFGREALLLSGQ